MTSCSMLRWPRPSPTAKSPTLNERLSNGFDLRCNSSQLLRSDASKQIALFARIDKLFDSDCENVGLPGEEPGDVDVPLFENFSNSRFVGPGQPD